MRLIDADALESDKFNRHFDDYAFQVIDNAPTIDAVEVVRCKDCKHYYNRDPQQIPTSSIMCGHMHPNDYCIYGERREHDETD